MEKQRKPTKTLSGVTPVAVVLPPRKCPHGTCVYCPSFDAPQSYTPKSPAIMRAMTMNYDPFKQVLARLAAFKAMKHPVDKIELIIMGGTFLAYPVKFQYNFVKRCYDALNGKDSRSLEEAKKINEKAKQRCTALCIETRPDICGDGEIKRMLEFGATRCELGVQAIDDKIYKKVQRGHSVKDVIEATRRLKDAGFKVFYHMMPGLPESNPRKDLQMFKKLFSDERFKPDGLKIYPCQVIKGSKLVKIYENGKYKPYSEEQTKEIIIKIMQIIPNYCRIIRVMREIPPDYLVAGTKRIDLRKDVEDEIRKRKFKINEIRFREIGFQYRDRPKDTINQDLKLKVTKYNASGGREYFLEVINKDNILFGLCRLRIRKENGASGAIRELHVYGQSLPIGEKGHKEVSQHKGLGKKLMEEAEKIARKEGVKELFIIAGIGVREYFYKLGYNPNGPYVSKKLK